MKILFLAHPYLNLHLPIIKELKNKGHEVIYIEDKNLKFDYCLLSQNKYLIYIKKKIRKIFKIEEKYWYNIIQNEKILNQEYDLLFCIQGVSFAPILLEHLRKYNKDIKSSLYLWDSIKYYNFLKNVSFFDKVYSFDLEDSIRYKNINFLPFYWYPTEYHNNIYDISMIGSEHDNRLAIVERLKKQLEINKLSYFIKIYIPIKNSKLTNFKLWFYQLIGYSKKIRKIKLNLGLEKSEFIIHTPISSYEVNQIMQKSQCILDTDKPTQTGTTPRLIWALALGKKIITTNNYIKKMPFYNEKQILIIDRNNPILDYNFIKSDANYAIDENILNLRIDKWVENFL